MRLYRMAVELETYFGTPQDIEWVWTDDTFHIVQSRDITANALDSPQPVLAEFRAPAPSREGDTAFLAGGVALRTADRGRGFRLERASGRRLLDADTPRHYHETGRRPRSPPSRRARESAS